MSTLAYQLQITAVHICINETLRHGSAVNLQQSLDDSIRCCSGRLSNVLALIAWSNSGRTLVFPTSMRTNVRLLTMKSDPSLEFEIAAKNVLPHADVFAASEKLHGGYQRCDTRCLDLSFKIFHICHRCRMQGRSNFIFTYPFYVCDTPNTAKASHCRLLSTLIRDDM